MCALTVLFVPELSHVCHIRTWMTHLGEGRAGRASTAARGASAPVPIKALYHSRIDTRQLFTEDESTAKGSSLHAVHSRASAAARGASAPVRGVRFLVSEAPLYADEKYDSLVRCRAKREQFDGFSVLSPE